VITTARLPKTICLEVLREPGHSARLVLLEPYHSFDKGKPVERRGRKAKDLKFRPWDHDSLVAVSENRILLNVLSAFIEWEKLNGTQKQVHPHHF
jgi:hypothetical protein